MKGGAITRIEIHTLAWTTVDPKIIKAHTDTCKFLGLNVNYTIQDIRHGEWMDGVMRSTKADVVLFLDIDCVPTNKLIVDKAIAWAHVNKSFVGIAQVSNHIPPYSHIFAAPAFFAISKEGLELMNRPTFLETEQCDVAENVSYAAEMMKIPYKTIYPTHYFKPPAEGIWKLHTYGEYGIGTHFEGGIFHLYQGRTPDNTLIFESACKAIQNNSFTLEAFRPCKYEL